MVASPIDVKTNLNFDISTMVTHPPPCDLTVSWESDLGVKVKDILAQAPAQDKPYMIALVGIPGSGKTSSGLVLARQLATLGVHSLHVGFDGYHYPLSKLKTFENPEDVVYRRGAVDTFDVESLKRDLKKIRDGKSPTVKLPSFDHAKGDPELDALTFNRKQHRVVLCDGLYLLHDDKGAWAEVKELFDFSIFVDADVDTCIERLKIRNLCIPGYTPEEIIIRCEAVDRVNAMTVIKSKERADLVVQSVAFRQM